MTTGVPTELHLLSAGAAQGLIAALAPKFLDETGATLRTTFGAVGAMREKLLAGARCDVLILTESIVDQLTATGHVLVNSAFPLGRVRTGIGVRSGDALPAVNDRAALKQSLRGATDIFLPDPERATAGIHFAKVLQRLGIETEVASRLRPFPNGAAAMAAMAQSTGGSVIGCTQVSEIQFAPGVTLVGPLPEEFELATVYSVAICTASEESNLARRFVRSLIEPEADGAREQAGFEPLRELIEKTIR